MKEAVTFLASRLKFRGKLCAAAISTSFFIIILSQSISGGFRKEIFNSLRSIGGDITLSAADGGNVTLDSTFIDSLLGIEGVKSVSPVIWKAGIIKDSSTVKGVLFKGTEEVEGNISAIIPHGLSESFRLEESGTFTAWFLGSRLKARNFRISGIYDNYIENGAPAIIKTDLESMRRICQMKKNEVSALEITLEESICGKEEIRTRAIEAGYKAMEFTREGAAPLYPKTIHDIYPQLFDWLNLIDVNVVALLIIMTIVAGFNMISGLLILLFRSISEIGLLKSLGMKDKDISAVFLRLSSGFVLKGMLIGNAAALICCIVEKYTRVIRLDATNYFLSYVPVSINPLSIILCDITSYLGIMLLLLIPSLFISHISPSESIRVS